MADTTTKLRSIVPATPGWFVVEYCSGDAEHQDSLAEEPVIAWIVTAEFDDDDDDITDSTARPVTADCPPHGPSLLILKRPDGKYFAPGDRWFNGPPQVLEYFQEVRQRRDQIRKVESLRPAS